MKKVMNEPDRFVDEMLEGLLLAYPDRLRCLDGDRRVILRNPPAPAGKVGIVTGGGSGHLPVFLGYVGEGLLDGCAVGNVFASPSAQKMAELIRACDQGAGVLCLYGNYGGDNMNFDMACETVEFDDIRTATVRVADDLASAPRGLEAKRRGVAGMVFAFKIAGAAAQRGDDLDGVAAVARKALDRTRTLGVALSPCVVPQVGKPTFSIKEDEIEIGMGIHGEPGIEVRPMMTADAVAALALAKLDEELALAAGDQVAVMVNGLGATPLEELLIVYRALHQGLAAKGVASFMPHVGEFATSMEMAGLSVTLVKLDAELKELLRAPGSSPFYSSANEWDEMLELPCLQATFRRIAETMARNQDYLVELDQQNGDGDLGLSMAAGYRALCGYLDTCGETDLGRILMKGAGVFNEAAPSTLGTLSSLFLMGMAKALKGKASADLPDVAAAMAAGLEHMMAKCGAKPGEKTIVDSLAAGVAELQARSGEDAAAAFAAAARAAEAGSEATRGMRAVHGRAAYYGDKSLGVLDGGSVVGALVFRAVAEAFGG